MPASPSTGPPPPRAGVSAALALALVLSPALAAGARLAGSVRCYDCVGGVGVGAFGPEAVALLDEFLVRVVRVQLLVAGNHDNIDRLGFGARLVAREGLYAHATLDLDAEPLVLVDEHGPVEVWTLPHLYPARVRDALVAAGDAPPRQASVRSEGLCARCPPPVSSVSSA